MTAHIMIDPSSFRLGGIGPSTGEIWLAFGRIAFPAPRWNDFVVVILEAFATALLRILMGRSTVERVHFMEGPYEVELRRESAGDLQLRALERGSIEKARAGVTRLDEFTSAAARRVIGRTARLRVCRATVYKLCERGELDPET